MVWLTFKAVRKKAKGTKYDASPLGADVGLGLGGTLSLIRFCRGGGGAAAIRLHRHFHFKGLQVVSFALSVADAIDERGEPRDQVGKCGAGEVCADGWDGPLRLHIRGGEGEVDEDNPNETGLFLLFVEGDVDALDPSTALVGGKLELEGIDGVAGLVCGHSGYDKSGDGVIVLATDAGGHETNPDVAKGYLQGLRERGAVWGLIIAGRVRGSRVRGLHAEGGASRCGREASRSIGQEAACRTARGMCEGCGA